MARREQCVTVPYSRNADHLPKQNIAEPQKLCLYLSCAVHHVEWYSIFDSFVCVDLVQGQSASAGKGLFSGIQLTSTMSTSSGPLPFSLTSSLASQKTSSSAFTSFSSQHTFPLQSLAGGTLPTLNFSGGSAEKKGQASTSSTGSGSGSAGSLYLSNLKSLNTSFLAWVEKHVRENPYVDLTPVFRDYEKHIGELERHNGPAPCDVASQSDSESQVGCKCGCVCGCCG